MACSTIRVFVVGDVMLARAIDMIQPYSCDPKLYEGNGLSALDYVSLVVAKNGPLPDESERGPEYVWGDAIRILDQKLPDVRIINLETSITTSHAPWPRKSVHYKMHPKNVSIIQAAQIDCCVLANNHTADWGFDGLRETLSSLKEADISYVGAGYDAQSAAMPFIMEISDKCRVLVFAVGHPSSGVLDQWKAKDHMEGLNMITARNLTKSVPDMKDHIAKYKQEGDVVIFSIHWGGNWGYDLEEYQQAFAHALILEAGVDVVYGHSSHHFKGVEIFNQKLIIYGCGDFINDYEGIDGHESYRGDISLMYFLDVESNTGNLSKLQMVPTKIKHLKVHECLQEEDIAWVHSTMSRECRRLGCDVVRQGNELILTFSK